MNIANARAQIKKNEMKKNKFEVIGFSARYAIKEIGGDARTSNRFSKKEANKLCSICNYYTEQSIDSLEIINRVCGN